MADSRESARIREEVERLLDQGFLGQGQVASVRVGVPLTVHDEDGAVHSWFVPLLVAQKITGFAQLLPSLTVMRVSSFERTPGDLDSCPDAADWIDAGRIRERARALARPGEVISEPVFTFDGNPSRLAWRTVMSSPAGERRVVFVAGTSVYEARRPY